MNNWFLNSRVIVGKIQKYLNIMCRFIVGGFSLSPMLHSRPFVKIMQGLQLNSASDPAELQRYKSCASSNQETQYIRS